MSYGQKFCSINEAYPGFSDHVHEEVVKKSDCNFFMKHYMECQDCMQSIQSQMIQEYMKNNPQFSPVTTSASKPIIENFISGLNSWTFSDIVAIVAITVLVWILMNRPHM